MKLVKLNATFFAQVDDEDFEFILAQGRWYLDNRGKRKYASLHKDGKKIYMHRLIMKAASGLDVDHLDGDGLNNQKTNLRIATRSQNNFNNHNVRSDNNSGVHGVYHCSYYFKWKAEIKLNGKKYTLGSFDSKQDAISARRLAEERIAQGLPPKIWTRKKSITGEND